MTDPTDTPRPRRIVQGHPTGFEPAANKGGQNGSPNPDGRSAGVPTPPPRGGADARESADDPGRGAD